MRRSFLFAGGALMGLLALCGTRGEGAVYEAPYYQTTTHQQEVSWAGSGAACCPNPCGQCGSCCGSPASKLTRGITNVVTGALEAPKHILMGVFSCNVTPLEGLGVGIFRGTGRAVERIGIGAWEAATFPFPGFDPLLCPEYVSWEPACMNWRVGEYSGWPCGPCAGCGGYVAQPAPQPAPPRAAPAQPEQPKPQAGAGTVRPGDSSGITYPDDYLK